MVGMTSVTHWLEMLLREKFFSACSVHESVKKNEKNIFCLDCSISFCPQCLPPHSHHRLLQIRRYVYHDVIRLDDAQKLMDCSLVQSYKTNSAKVVFLNQRPMSRPFRSSGSVCITCERSLQDPYLYCSLACKYGLKGGEFSELLDSPTAPGSLLESPGSLQTSSGSSASNNGGDLSCKAVASSVSIELVKKKRRSMSVSRSPYRQTCSPASEVAVFMNRRKGMPHRSPLY